MRRRDRIIILLVAVVLIDVLAFVLFPPFDPKPAAGSDPAACAYPVCFINGNLELPAPHVVLPIGHHSPPGLVVFDPSISASLFTMWIVAALVLGTLVVLTRGMRMVPSGRQNVVEWVYETLETFALSLGGPQAKPFIPLFAAFFLFILFSNWSGLVPPIGKVTFLRAPTSDVNVTIGLALVAFGFFEFQGFKALGIRGYLSKFFPLGEFRKGLGAGAIALFVGLVELLLEFVKPVTLSMRLFGNIYGGEVALGVMTALTVAIIPVGLFALEVMLNLVQALIFSTLMLMFTLAAIEQHGDDHDDVKAHAPSTDPTLAPAGAH
jgi:F-type H+-transporting ATPase subunit a